MLTVTRIFRLSWETFFMRVGAAVALTCALLTAGCGSMNALPTTPIADRSSPPQGPGQADRPQASDDRPTPSETQRRKAARAAPASDASARDVRSDTGTDGMLSPGWAKDEQADKEDWEKSLDKTIRNVCRGC